MRRVVPFFAVLLALAAVGPTSAAPSPRRAADRRARIDALERQLDALAEEAKKTPAPLALVNAYRRFTPEQLANPDSPITAEQLLEVCKDETNAPEVREAAAQAIVWAVASDRVLDAGGKGNARARAKFSRKVFSLLTDKDVFSRGLGKSILEGLWPGVRDPDIMACNPRQRPTCNAAKNAWDKFLGR